MEDIRFDYYYGKEAEQFTFFRIPKLLIKDSRFRELTSDAKLLYGLMLDRMSMSVKNGWFDAQNRAYIIYSLETVVEDLGCGKSKAAKVMKELDNKDGIGLIERVRQGLGKPDIIYVKNFCVRDNSLQNNLQDESKAKLQNVEIYNSEKENTEDSCDENKQIIIQKVDNLSLYPQKTDKNSVIEDNSCENDSSELLKTTLQSVEKQHSGVLQLRLQECCNLTPNKNNINNTEINKIYHINQSNEDKDNKMIDKMDEIEAYRQLIRENIDYDSFVAECDSEYLCRVDEIYETICDMVTVPRQKVIIEKVEYPYAVVKSRFLKLNSSHVDYTINAIKHYKGEIRNMKGFMITTLYNAPGSSSICWDQSIQHSSFGGEARYEKTDF